MICGSRRRLLRTGLALAGLGLATGCGLAPWSGQGQRRKVARVGFIGPSGIGVTVDAIRTALRERGYVDGEQLDFQVRLTGSSPEEIAGAAAELVNLPVELIVANGNVYALAVKERSSTIPIVLGTGADPIRSGLAASLARPGGSVTGITAISHYLSAKRLALLKEAVPSLQRVGALWNHSSTTKLYEWQETEQAAQAVGVQVHSLGTDDFQAAVQAIRREGLQGLLMFEDSTTSNLKERITDLIATDRLPLMSEFRRWTEIGGLMSYGPSFAEQVRRVADYVDRILKGAKPADLPIEQPTIFDFIINLKTAQALGLTIPDTVLAQATEVIR